ncbi:MAG: S41 family peptidase [Bacteroidota bacterium]
MHQPIIRWASLALLCTFSPLALYSQPTISAEEAQADFEVFKDILQTAHPSLYSYTPPHTLDSLYQAFEQDYFQDSLPVREFFSHLSHLADFVRDGHLTIHHPEMDPVPPLFPVFVKIIGGRFFTDSDELGIPLGSEILFISGVSSKLILQDLLKYASTDGYAYTKKYRQIEREFGIMHLYAYGSSSEYQVEYLTPEGLRKTTGVQPQSMEAIGQRFLHRSSHFAAYHQNPNTAEHFISRVVQPKPFVYYVDSLEAAVLTVNSFGVDPREFKSTLVDLFKELKKERVRHLVVDIRRNPGGYRANAITLYSFLTQEPFTQRTRESAITDALPQPAHVFHTMSDYADFFAMYFGAAQKEDGRWILEKDRAEAEMIPAKKPFKGQVYVLIGGTTFSAATAFALNAKNDPRITLIGEETGGGYYFHTGQYPVMYQLPHSGVLMRMSLVRIEKFVRDTSVPQGSGVLPDEVVRLSVDDLRLGRDAVLHRALLRISEQ